MGSASPRLSTGPLGPLTEASSRGFAFAEWCEEIGLPLLPWQREAAVRAMETTADGSYRYKTILILVGRQSGKTTLLKLLALWRMLFDDARMVLGVAQSLDIAKEAWQGAVDYIEDALPAVVEKVRYASGENTLELVDGSRYRIAAASRKAGRGLTVDLLILDEVREQRDWLAWQALSKTTSVPKNAQTWCISNAGDDQSVVLNHLRAVALSGDSPRTGLFEWSAPDGCDTQDPANWAMACPALGHTITADTLRAYWETDPEPVFRTEVLCQSVRSMHDVALDQAGWAAGAVDGDIPGKSYAGIDVALDGRTCLYLAGAVGSGVRVEPLASWPDPRAALSELPAMLRSLGPASVAWYPGGPADVLAPLLLNAPWSVPLSGVTVKQACASFADLVAGGLVQHEDDDPDLDGQVSMSVRKDMGDGFVFTRGSGGCHALYAALGACWLARTAGPPKAGAFVL